MKKEEIIQKIEENHTRFIGLIAGLEADKFTKSSNSKWTPGQQIDHICRSVRPLSAALGLPNFILKMILGSSNKPSMSYEEVLEKYHFKLQNGGRATGRFVPQIVPSTEQKRLVKELTHLVHNLAKRVNRCSEKDLDTLVMPHPLLGKLTLREMLYFTIYHVEHHRLQMEKHVVDYMV